MRTSSLTRRSLLPALASLSVARLHAQIRPMRVLVQWTTSSPGDWVETTAALWSGLPSRPAPRPGQLGGLDLVPGHVFAVAVQGMVFTGQDHYHVRELPEGGCRVTCWNDDPADFPGRRNARIHDFLPLAPDPALRGAINTRQRVIFYDEVPTQGARTWNEFVPPVSDVRHGIWTLDDVAVQHARARSVNCWWDRRWADHLSSAELDAEGDLKSQRDQGRFKPNDHTITWYWTTTNRAVGIYAAVQEKALSRSVGSGSITVNLAAGAAGVEGLTLTSPASDPNQGSWPTGNYRCQMDISSLGTSCSIRLENDDSETNYVRLNSALTTIVDNEYLAVGGSAANIVTTGIHLMSTGATGSWSPSGSTASDVVMIRFVVTNGNMMAAEDIIFTCDSDAFVDGPWTEGGVNAVRRLTSTGVGK